MDPTIDWKERGKTPADVWSEEKRNNVRKILDELDFNDALEVGCGDGQFSEILKNSRCALVGIDLSENRLDKNDHLDMKICNNFNSFKFYERYDLVCCSHLLLHIPPNIIDSFYVKMKLLAKKYMLIIEPDIFQYDSLNWAYGNYPYDYNKFDDFESFDVDHKVKAWLRRF